MLCPSCGQQNREGRRFCTQCGAALASACPSCGAATEAGERFCGQCGSPISVADQPRTPTPALAPSQTLPSSFAAGRYQVRRFLGEGGRKRVYLAHDSRLDRDVAIALIKTEGLDADGLARVKREAQAMGRLGDNPNIVTIHDIGEESGQPFIVSQYMAGGSLEDLLRAEESHRLPMSRTLALAIQIAEGLEHAHGQGVIHRDIKPGNVWLSQDGTAKLGDFGLAVALDRSRLTLAGTMVGTAAYMPPEQALGGQADTRSDLYSLGCVLYEMLTGRPPFLGDDTLGIISQHVNAPPVVPSWHNTEAPPALDALVLRLLAKSPDDRPGSASDVASALTSIATAPVEASIHAPAVSPLPPSGYVRSPFVGRSAELEELKGRMEGAMSGNGSLVMVVGEPGIGKTRLTEELSVYARMRGAQVLFGQCYEGEGAPPYIPFIEALRQYVAGRPAEALRSELGDAASDIARLVSEVRSTLPDIPHAPEGEPEAERYRLLEAVTSFLVNASTANPLLLVLDDIHWADKPSLLLLQHLARRLAGTRILAMGTYRDVELDRRHPLSEVVAELRRERLYHRVLLRGLDDEGVLALLQGRAGHEVERPFAVALQRQTEGNPFFIEEITLHLVESGALRWEEGRYVAANPTLIQQSIPEGVREVIGRRLSGRSQATNEALTFASVLGREFEFDILVLLAGMSEDDLLSALEEALDVRLIEEHRGSGRAAYRFSHALIRETLYGELSIVRKQRFHLRAGLAIEQARAGHLDAYIGPLANHFYQGNDPEKAIDYCRRAGEASARVYAWEEALKHWEAALELMEEQGATDEALAGLLERMGDVTYVSGIDLDRGRALLERALALYERMGARGKVAATHSRLGRGFLTYFGRTDLEKGSAHLEAARAILEEDAPEGAALAYVYIGLCTACLWRGKMGEGMIHSRRALEIGEKLNSRPVTAMALAFTGNFLGHAGGLREGLDMIERGWAIADEDGLTFIAFLGAMFSGAHHVFTRSDPGEAKRWLQRELARPRLASAPMLRRMLLSFLGSAYLIAGEMDEARRLGEDLTDDSSFRAVLLFASGDWETAEEHMLSGLQESSRTRVTFSPFRFEHRLGEICLRRGELDRAEEHLRAYYRDIEQARAFTIGTRLMLVQVLAQQGRLTEAQDELAECGLLLEGEDWGGTAGRLALARGTLAAGEGDWDIAEEAFDNAAEVARRYGLPWDEADALHERARMHLARGEKHDRQRALGLFDETIAIYRRLGAKKHLELVLADKLSVQGLSSTDIYTSIDRVAAAVQSQHPDLKPHAAPDGTVTIMFSDIEGSTEKTDRLGDRSWMTVLREHNAIVRKQVKAHSGFEVKSEGDGFMVAFQSARKAVDCAVAIQKSLAERNAGIASVTTVGAQHPSTTDEESPTTGSSVPSAQAVASAAPGVGARVEPILVRIGLHAGEVIKEGEDFFGRNVIMAARVASQACGGQILVSGVLKSLLDGSGVDWGEPRTVELKGLPGEHKICAVQWGE